MEKTLDWQMITITKDDNILKAYLNGALVSTTQLSSKLESTIATVMIGQEIGSVIAVDPESHQKLTYHIADGKNSGYFHMD